MKIELNELSSIGSVREPVVFKGMHKEEEDKDEKENQMKEAIYKANNTSPGIADILCFLCKKKTNTATSREKSTIRLDGTVYPINTITNAINNRKYSVLGFIPVVLFNQFKYFFNMFFLLLALSQFVPPLKVGLLFSYIAPLVFVLTLTMLKEGVDDIKRYIRDRDTNNQKYKKLTETGLVDCTSASVKVGDIIEVHANQRIPADLVLLYTNDVSGTVFIRTDQLDGETDWKLRKPIATTQALVAAKKNLRVVPGAVQCNPPSKLIYEFIGVYEGDDGKKEPLDLENTMWANTVLCSGKILGLIIFTGKETRMAMNSKDAREKRGSLDLELNVLSKVLFIFMTILSILIVLASGTHENLLFFTIKFILLTSSIIPISLRVNLDFSKIVFSYKISNDPRMPGALARNSEIPEELGRIQFILSDKTGTLTQNEMIFKNLSLEQNQFKDEDIDELRKILKSECTKEKGPMPDVFRRMQETRDKGKTVKRVSDKVVRDMLTAIAVCHNVTPVDEDGVKTYQASSPDEVALVKLAESVGLSLEFRDQKTMKLKNAIGAEENYEILENFPFSSETKRMGIVVRHKETNRLIFYLKGADVALVNKVPEIQKGFLQDECENLAREGLRTLVITQRALTESEYQDWKKVYYAAQISSNRAENTKAAIEQLEKGMDFLGITGVEDKLQEDVRVSIESIRNAGIQFWMLTGDKIETACCIAISTSLKTPQQDFFIMRDMTDTQTMERKLNEFGNNINNQRDQVLVIDGQSIHTVTEYNESMFFSLACRVTSVICCRCSPTQKAYITEKIKHYTGKKTLGIGDGGNDVGMILSADVGVGIVGKEGKQAALASDFSIYKFKHVTNLLLWHGRNSYKRGAVMAQFVIHRGLIISIMQMYFSIMFYYVAIPLFNGFLMLGYGTVFTMLPVFSLIFDEDVDYDTAMKFPPLYKSLQKGRELSIKSFLLWLCKSIYQGFIIMTMAIMLFKTPMINMVTITFTSLILIEILNVFSEVSKLTRIVGFSCGGSVLLYLLCLYFFPDYLDASAIDAEFIEYVSFTVIVAWLPLFLLNWLQYTYYPTEDQKLMKQVTLGREGKFKEIMNLLMFWKKDDIAEIKKEFIELK